MSWTLTLSGSAIAKAGTHASSVLTLSGSLLAGFSDMAEGRIITETRRDWVTSYATLPTGVKGLLSDVASSLVAMDIVAYNPTGYLTREADMIMNMNDDRINRGLAILKDFKSNEIKTP
jgi:hypothetical protein